MNNANSSESQTPLGCFMPFVDAVAIFLTTMYFLDSWKMHIVFHILIAICASIIIQILMRVPILGQLLKVSCGLGIALIAYIAVENNTGGHIGGDIPGKGAMTQLYENDQIWWWTIIIIGSLIFVGLHFATCAKTKPLHHQTVLTSNDNSDTIKQGLFYGADDSFEDVDLPENTVICGSIDDFNNTIDKYNNCGDEITAIAEKIANSPIMNDCSEQFVRTYNTAVEKWEICQNRCEACTANYPNADLTSRMAWLKSLRDSIQVAHTAIEQLKNEYESALTKMAAKSSSSKPSISFFHGCDTIEKLNKRYKSLAKTYHPDTDVGDTETMQTINAEYEKLKAEYAKD